MLRISIRKCHFRRNHHPHDVPAVLHIDVLQPRPVPIHTTHTHNRPQVLRLPGQYLPAVRQHDLLLPGQGAVLAWDVRDRCHLEHRSNLHALLRGHRRRRLDANHIMHLVWPGHVCSSWLVRRLHKLQVPGWNDRRRHQFVHGMHTVLTWYILACRQLWAMLQLRLPRCCGCRQRPGHGMCDLRERLLHPRQLRWCLHVVPVCCWYFRRRFKCRHDLCELLCRTVRPTKIKRCLLDLSMPRRHV